MKVGFIGFGRMGGALVQGAITSGVLKKSDVFVFDLSADSRRRSRQQKIQATPTLESLLEKTSLIFLCVKPQSMGDLIAHLVSWGKKKPLGSRCFVSIAAGIRLKDLEKSLGAGVPVLRAMPNTPALLRAGVTGLCRGRHVTTAQARTVEKILSGVGDVVAATDQKMDALTAVSGSGPAYVFYVAEAMMAAARKFGFSATEARRLVHRTFYGAGQMLEQRAESAEELRRQVTSPGGTTEAAIRQMERSQVKKKIGQALERAAQRSKELSQKILL